MGARPLPLQLVRVRRAQRHAGPRPAGRLSPIGLSQGPAYTEAMHVLVTGGCGYIGTHTVVELLGAGHRVTVVDNLSNASAKALDAVERVTGASVP
ncbi:MAG TPA: NAD-dependent epimerase/dehydratase family protein, partial [Acidimicrobiales bacterium]|nr:NAD-dependent epimerase/dehydratase family protein [Acidimicrobiales bacterium]